MKRAALDHALSLAQETIRASGGTLPELSSKQIDRLRAYLEILLQWRDRVALIATADPVRLVEHHVLDSLHLVRHLSGSMDLADIGSGAGFPGVPLAVALPASRVTLVESRRKKANFLREVRRAVRLENVEVIEGRAEDIGDREFDAVVSRALGPVGAFLDLASELLRSTGVAIAMRGPEGSKEGAPWAGFAPPRVVSYPLAMGRRRTLLIYHRL